MRCFFALVIMLFAWLGCHKEKDQADADDAKIDDYLSAIGVQVKEHKSGFRYLFDVVDSSCAGGCDIKNMCSSLCGDGCLRPCDYSFVEFHYSVFDIDSLMLGDTTPIISTFADSTERNYVTDLIPAMELAFTELEDFTLGSAAFLLIPSRLAYKHYGLDSTIRPDASLLMYVYLVESHPHF